MSRIRSIPIFLENFSNPQMNGPYLYGGYHDGKPYYTKKVLGYENKPYEYFIIYKKQNGPYSFDPAWYLIQITDNKLEKPIYKNKDINLDDNSWEPMLEPTSGEIETSGFKSKISYLCAHFYYYNSSDGTGTDLVSEEFNCLPVEKVIEYEEVYEIPINEVFTDTPIAFFSWGKDMKIEIQTLPDATSSEWISYDTEEACVDSCNDSYACVTFRFYRSDDGSCSGLEGEVKKCLDKHLFDSILRRKNHKINECFSDLPPLYPSSFGWGRDMYIEYDKDFSYDSYLECLEGCFPELYSSSSSSSSSYQDSSSSSELCNLDCCGCEDVKLAVNINADLFLSATATDISQLDNQYQSTSGGGTGLDGTTSYTSNGGSHYNGGGNEYCLFHPYDAIYPLPLNCNSESAIVDNNGCLDLLDNNFDIRLAVYINSSNIGNVQTLVSKWDADPFRGWSLDWAENFVTPGTNFGLIFSWSDDGTNYSQIDYEFGVFYNPTPTEDQWLEVRVARSGGTIKVYFDGTAMTRTSSDFSGGGEGASFYAINMPVIFGNNFEVVSSPSNAGFLGNMDYFFVQVGGTVDLSNYTPAKVPFSLPDYI
jgi:hypothetical protein